MDPGQAALLQFLETKFRRLLRVRALSSAFHSWAAAAAGSAAGRRASDASGGTEGSGRAGASERLHQRSSSGSGGGLAVPAAPMPLKQDGAAHAEGAFWCVGTLQGRHGHCLLQQKHTPHPTLYRDDGLTASKHDACGGFGSSM